MIALARGCIVKDPDFLPTVAGNVYAFDSTTIDLCLNVFWRAAFRTAKGCIKVHTLYDIKTSIPCFLLVTEALLHDVNALDHLSYEPGGYYIMDNGYIDYSRLYHIHCCKAFFVTRAKDNFSFTRRYSSKADKSKGILCGQTVLLSGFYANKDYPQPLGRIKFSSMRNKDVASCSSPIILASQQKTLPCYINTVGRWNYSLNGSRVT